MTPVLGQLDSANTAINGYKFVNGEAASIPERVFSVGTTALAASPFLGIIKNTSQVRSGAFGFLRPNAAIGRLGLADNALGQVDNVMLDRLRLGAQVEVPAGTQGIRKAMSDLSVVSGNEVALIRMESGRRLIVMGGPNTIALPPRTARIIAHTHPQGSLRFSAPDIRALNARGQRSSVIISPREDFGIRLPVPCLGN